MIDRVLRVQLQEGMRHLNITSAVEAKISGLKMEYGYIHISVEHTTCTLLLQEDEPGLMIDLFDRLDIIAPPSKPISVQDSMAFIREGEYRKAMAYYRHDDLEIRTVNLEEGTDERRNGHAHVRASLVGQPFLTIEVANYKLKLGRWQQVLLLDFDDLQDRRERTVTVSIMDSWQKRPGYLA